MEISDEDLLDIENDIYETMDQTIEYEVSNMSSPNFHQNFIDEITTIFYEYWLDCGICTEDDYDEIEEIIENLAEIYFDISGIPPRSYAFGITVDEQPKDFEKLTRQIEFLKSIPQPKQKTKEWHEYRYGLITASNLYKALGSESEMNSLIYEKCKPIHSVFMENRCFGSENSMEWGVKYEPVTSLVYEHMFQTKVDEFGCIPHSKYKFIGASPDGINFDISNKERFGRMVEIKNIFNREITGIPKKEYWVQCQIQLETCDLDDCDFIETRFKEFEKEEDFYNDTEHEYKGVILHFAQRTSGYSIDVSNSIPYNNSPIYKYMPLDVSTDKETIDNWIDTMKETYKNEIVLFKTVYWYMDEFSCVLVKRNKSWFNSVITKIEKVWNIITKERVDGFQHRAPKKRTGSFDKTIVVEKKDSNNIQQIRNMPLTNSICLIKLDENGF
jgi:putative phage-type endonuclease